MTQGHESPAETTTASGSEASEPAETSEQTKPSTKQPSATKPLSTAKPLTAAQRRIVAALVLAAFVVGLWMYGAQFGHALTRFVLGSWPSVIVLVLGLTAAAFLRRRRGSSAAPTSTVPSDENPRSPWSDVSLPTLVSGVTVVLAVAVVPFLMGYAKAKAYAESVRVVSEPVPAYQERPPYDVAKALADRSLGDTTGDASGVIKALPATQAYSTTIIRRGLFQGYESAQMLRPPLNGSARAKDVTICSFSEDAALRFGGAVPRNNLPRAIYWKTSPLTTVRESDAVAFCEEDGTPRIYVPLVTVKLLPVPHDVPAGVAIYNGKTGELRVQKELKSELPLYPKSIAEEQRSASQASSGFLDWLFRRAGWEDTSVDKGDPNGENRAEFALTTTNGETQFVTPLTPRGSSSSIVALGTVPASGTVTAGKLNPYTIHRLEQPRQANSTVAARITTEKLDSYKATGLSVFEVVPADTGRWTATIGKDQNILYHASIAQDGTITLTGGSEQKDQTQTPAATGSLGDISGMTEAEIRTAIDALLDELEKRAAAG